MILAAALLFAMAFLGGSQVVLFHLRGDDVPAYVGLGHGMTATGGVVCLWLGLGEIGFMNLAGAAFAIALLSFLGGAYLFKYRFARKRPPVAYMLAHGALALAALALLAVHIIAGGSAS